jgi:hypothetical protein
MSIVFLVDENPNVASARFAAKLEAAIKEPGIKGKLPRDIL